MRWRRPLVLVILWVVSAVLVWSVLADYLAHRFIGLDPTRITHRPAIVVGAVVLVTVVLTALSVRRWLVARAR